MQGVLESFATHVAGLLPDDDVHLFLVGPDVSGVSDDPEGVQVLAECTEAWRGLLRTQRQRISLVSLPMQDTDENAAIVNAVQRHASIVAQKSLVEGFGLTVAEAMWKARPVVGGAVGGILDQITDGEDGLLAEPLDYEGFGAALRKLFADLGEAHRMGLAAQEKVRRQFLPDRQLTQWIQLFDQMQP
jgi:trehalose synthase